MVPMRAQTDSLRYETPEAKEPASLKTGNSLPKNLH